MVKAHLFWIVYILGILLACSYGIYKSPTPISVSVLVLGLVLLGWKIAMLDAALISEKVAKMGPQEPPKKKEEKEEEYWRSLCGSMKVRKL